MKEKGIKGQVLFAEVLILFINIFSDVFLDMIHITSAMLID